MLFLEAFIVAMQKLEGLGMIYIEHDVREMSLGF